MRERVVTIQILKFKVVFCLNNFKIENFHKNCFKENNFNVI